MPTDLHDADRMARSIANRIGSALIVAALLVSSALMARVDHTVSLVFFSLAFAMGVYMMWKIVRTPGEL